MKENKNLLIAIGIAILAFLFSWRYATILHVAEQSEDMLQGIENYIAAFSMVFTSWPKLAFSGEVLSKACIFTLVIMLLCAFAFSGQLMKKWRWDAFYDYKRRESKVKPKSMQIRVNKFGANELSEMVGLENVKREVDQIIAYYKVQRERKKKGLQASDLNLNFVFYGNPGTGKTIVARYIARELNRLGILKKGQMFEADRSLMVSSSWGGTPALVHEVVEAALGGALFIDEAYTLTATRDEAGQEAIATLL